MDNLYIASMLLMSFIVFITMILSRCKKTALGRVMTLMLFFVFSIILSYMIALFSSHYLLSSIAYSIYFVLNSWLCATMYVFSCVYIGKKKPSHIIEYSVLVLFIADNISLVLNIFLQHEITYSHVIKAGLSCWTFQPLPLFTAHLVFCYFLIFFFFYFFTRELLKAPAIYKMQYAAFLIILVLCVGGNALFLLNNNSLIDISVIFYGAAALLFYHANFLFLPKNLTRNMTSLIANNLDSAMIFFDLNRECIYANKKAQEWFPINIATLTQDDLNAQYHLPESTLDKYIVEIKVNDIDRTFQVNYQRFSDEKKRYIGAYYEFEDVTQMVEEQEASLYHASHDPLTDVYNRSTFLTEVRKFLYAYPHTNYSIITTNVYQFKILNDLLGRTTCDELLKVIGETLYDVNKDGVIFGRLESDKFVICAPSFYTLENDFQSLISKRINLLKEKHNISLNICVDCGVYQIENRTMDIEGMIDRANIALDTVKDDAIEHIGRYDAKLRDKLLESNALLKELPEAIKNHHFILYYQPQINCKDNTLVGAEALVRWNHPEHGLIPPIDFIPLLERTGLIYQLDQYVWGEACKTIKILRSQHITIPISVNVSPRDIYACDLIETFTQLIRTYEIPASSLNIEITESTLISNIDTILEIIKNLQDLGFHIEMDDFGSGYSSLNALKDIPVNVLKLDAGFIHNAKNMERAKTVLNGIIHLAHSLEIPLIAEGIENQNAIDYFKKSGCYNIQGYYYSKPLPYEEFAHFISQYDIGELK